MTKYSKKIKIYLIIITFFYLSLIVSFLLDENSSGGSKADFLTTLNLVEKISHNFFFGIKEWTNSSLTHFPFHYLISAVFLKLLDNVEIVRFIFLNICVLIPIFFYKCIKITFKNEAAAMLLPILIFISPYFRSSAIWLTTDNTAIIFFIISIFFFIKTIRHNKNKNINYYYFLFFLFLSSFTRQYYILFLVFFLFKLYQKKNYAEFKIKIIYLIVLVFFFLCVFIIKLLKSQNHHIPHLLTNNIYNNIYINLSIIFFYLSPFIFLFKENIINFFIFLKKKKYIHIIFFCILTLFLYKFDYNSSLGGGFYLKLTNTYFTKIIFLFICFLGFSIIYYLTYNNLNNFILIIILFSIFNYNVIYQKYFDPLLIIIFFTLFEHKAINIIIKKIWPNFMYLFIYFFLFWLISIITHINKINI
jgi:hypothetical protein